MGVTLRSFKPEEHRGSLAQVMLGDENIVLLLPCVSQVSSLWLIDLGWGFVRWGLQSHCIRPVILSSTFPASTSGDASYFSELLLDRDRIGMWSGG